MNDPSVFEGDILVNGTRIQCIEKENNDVVDRVIDCKGNVIIPGFKNAHAHSAMTFLRGGGEGLSLHDWLFTYCFPREDKLIPSDVYNAAKVAFVEYIKGGITASFDQYFFPLETARAANDIGFRVSLQGTYNKFTTKDDMIKFYNFYNNKEDSFVAYVVGVHAEYTLDDELVKYVGEVLKNAPIPFYTHISETKDEVEGSYSRHGVSPVKYFDSLGFFNNGGGGYHCNFFSDEDIEIFKKHNMSIITNPGSNKYLNSGVCPVQKYFDLGFNVAIGTDGPASNYDLDMFMEMRMIKENNPLLPSYEILKMATSNGAKAMYLKDCESLSEGKFADLVVLDASNFDNGVDIYDEIVNKGNKNLVNLTMISGKILYENGEFFLNEKIPDIYAKCQEVKTRIDNELKN